MILCDDRIVNEGVFIIFRLLVKLRDIIEGLWETRCWVFGVKGGGGVDG